MSPQDNLLMGNGTKYAHCTTIEIAVDLVFVSVAAVIGVIGNIFVILVVSLVPAMKKSMNWLLVNIAVADLLICAFIIPNIFVNRIACHNVTAVLACSVSGVLLFNCAGVSNFTFMAISVNRRLYVLGSNWYGRVFGGKKIFAGIVLIWVFWLGFSLLAHFFNSFHYISRAYFCFYYDDIAPFSISLILSLLAVALPTGLAIYCYSSILFIFFSNRRKVSSESSAENSGMKETLRLISKDRKTLVSMTSTFFFFNVCWGPYCIHLYLDLFHIYISNEMYKIMTWLAVLNSAFNPVVLYISHSRFRESFFKVLKCKPREPLSNSSMATSATRSN